MRVALVWPKNRNGVFLNEDLVFSFTNDIDRASVTNASVRIQSAEGRPARGTFSVEGRALKFTPAPVLGRDLEDGGYAAGTVYQVELRGFPAVDGLRGAQGEPLESTYHFEFTTVALEGQNLMFVDPEPEQTKPLVLFPPPASAAESRYVIGTDDPIYLASSKPIDPRTLDDSGFQLVFQGAKSSETPASQVNLRARLAENENDARRAPAPTRANDNSAWEREPRAALIALTPGRKLETGKWMLVFGPPDPTDERPMDFSAHVLVNPGRFAREIEVREGGGDTQDGELRLDFLDRNLQSPVALPGVDGTAHWGDGRVSVRYPAAAGDGSAGDVMLASELGATDVQALDLALEKDRTCTLPAEPGLVALRCQGRMQIGGNLRRSTAAKIAEKKGTKHDEARHGDEVQAGEQHAGGMDFTEGDLALSTPGKSTATTETLSSWLARMRAENRNCTVLIAGGDLVIDSDAEVVFDTPLLLVAGGIVRIEGSVRVTSGSVYVLEDGGGLHVEPTKQTANLLTMDPPRDTNPLRRELHLAVLSSPLPSRGLVAAWKGAETGASPRSPLQAPLSRWSVRFVHEVLTMPKSIAELDPVDDPIALDPVGPIQVLIEIWVSPSAMFDPPFIDYVDLHWDQRVTGRSR